MLSGCNPSLSPTPPSLSFSLFSHCVSVLSLVWLPPVLVFQWNVIAGLSICGTMLVSFLVRNTIIQWSSQEAQTLVRSPLGHLLSLHVSLSLSLSVYCVSLPMRVWGGVLSVSLSLLFKLSPSLACSNKSLSLCVGAFPQGGGSHQVHHWQLPRSPRHRYRAYSVHKLRGHS